jgi:hypothetical protein
MKRGVEWIQGLEAGEVDGVAEEDESAPLSRTSREFIVAVTRSLFAL